jgi:hypothetical protein
VPAVRVRQEEICDEPQQTALTSNADVSISARFLLFLAVARALLARLPFWRSSKDIVQGFRFQKRHYET